MAEYAWPGSEWSVDTHFERLHGLQIPSLEDQHEADNMQDRNDMRLSFLIWIGAIDRHLLDLNGMAEHKAYLRGLSRACALYPLHCIGALL
jgi:hypothetical protein